MYVCACANSCRVGHVGVLQISLGGGMPNTSFFPIKGVDVHLSDGTTLPIHGADMNAALQYSPSVWAPSLCPPFLFSFLYFYLPAAAAAHRGWVGELCTVRRHRVRGVDQGVPDTRASSPLPVRALAVSFFINCTGPS
jgi:hypothetical protein